MTLEDFYKIAKRTEDSRCITWDARPFGNRQAEAVCLYLYEISASIRNATLPESKAIVILTDYGSIYLPQEENSP
jgi:hypothetical protein